MDFSDKKPTSCHLIVKMMYSGITVDKNKYTLEDEVIYNLTDLKPGCAYYELVNIGDNIDPLTDKPNKSFLNKILGYTNRDYACFNSNSEYEDASVIEAYFKFGFDGPTVSDIVSDFIKTSLETKKCQGWCGEILNGCKCYNPAPSFIPSLDNNKVIPGYYYQRYYGKGSENSGYYIKHDFNHDTKPAFIKDDKFRGNMKFYTFKIDRVGDNTGYYLNKRLPPNRQAPRLNENEKTKIHRKICMHYKNGKCAFGDKCRNFHY